MLGDFYTTHNISRSSRSSSIDTVRHHPISPYTQDSLLEDVLQTHERLLFIPSPHQAEHVDVGVSQQGRQDVSPKETRRSCEEHPLGRPDRRRAEPGVPAPHRIKSHQAYRTIQVQSRSNRMDVLHIATECCACACATSLETRCSIIWTQASQLSAPVGSRRRATKHHIKAHRMTYINFV